MRRVAGLALFHRERWASDPARERRGACWFIKLCLFAPASCQTPWEPAPVWCVECASVDTQRRLLPRATVAFAPTVLDAQPVTEGAPRWPRHS